MKFFLSIAKYFIIVLALSAIPFISGLQQLHTFQGIHTWKPQALQTQKWFTSQIHNDEKILWCSGISSESRVAECMPLAFSGVLFAISGVLFIGLMNLAKQVYAHGVINVIGSLIVIFGIILSIYPYWVRYHDLRSACVLTDKRAINIFDEKACESIPYTSEEIQKPFILSGVGDSQTLVFYRSLGRTTSHIFYPSVMDNRATGFKNISDGATALAILTAQTDKMRPRAQTFGK